MENNYFYLFHPGAEECLKWHDSKHINVELYGEMFCAGHSDGHQDACLGRYFYKSNFIKKINFCVIFSK